MTRVERAPQLPEVKLVRKLSISSVDGREYKAFSSRTLTPTTFSFSEGSHSILTRIGRAIQRAFKALVYGSYSLASSAQTIELLSRHSADDVLAALADEQDPQTALNTLITKLAYLEARLVRKETSLVEGSKKRTKYAAARGLLVRARGRFERLRAPVSAEAIQAFPVAPRAGRRAPPTAITSLLPEELTIPAPPNAPEGFIAFRRSFETDNSSTSDQRERAARVTYAKDIQMRIPKSVSDAFETAISAAQIHFPELKEGVIRLEAQRAINLSGPLAYEQFSAFFKGCTTRVQDISVKQFFAATLRGVPGDGYLTHDEAEFRATLADRIDSIPVANRAALHEAIAQELKHFYPEDTDAALIRFGRRINRDSIPSIERYHLIFKQVGLKKAERQNVAKHKFMTHLLGGRFSRESVSDSPFLSDLSSAIEKVRLPAHPRVFHDVIEDAVRAYSPRLTDEHFASIDRNVMPTLSAYKRVLTAAFRLRANQTPQEFPFPPAPPQAVMVAVPEVTPPSVRMAEARAAVTEGRLDQEEALARAETTFAELAGPAEPTLDADDPEVQMALQQAILAAHIRNGHKTY